MQPDPAPPNAKPLLGLLAELRAQVQPRAETPGTLARLHAFILALLTQLIALIEALPQAESAESANTSRPWRRAARHSTPRAPETFALVRIMYVIGPAPNRGMRARPAPCPSPELRPPIAPPRARSLPRRARAQAQARSHPLADKGFNAKTPRKKTRTAKLLALLPG